MSGIDLTKARQIIADWKAREACFDQIERAKMSAAHSTRPGKISDFLAMNTITNSGHLLSMVILGNADSDYEGPQGWTVPLILSAVLGPTVIYLLPFIVEKITKFCHRHNPIESRHNLFQLLRDTHPNNQFDPLLASEEFKQLLIDEHLEFNNFGSASSRSRIDKNPALLVQEALRAQEQEAAQRSQNALSSSRKLIKYLGAGVLMADLLCVLGMLAIYSMDEISQVKSTIEKPSTYLAAFVSSLVFWGSIPLLKFTSDQLFKKQPVEACPALIQFVAPKEFIQHPRVAMAIADSSEAASSREPNPAANTGSRAPLLLPTNNPV